MDHIKTKEQFPEAWEKFIEWSGLRLSWHPFDSHNQLRIIYDFFDENGIIIEIGVDCTMEPKYCYKVHEHIETDLEWHSPKWSDLYLHRSEAESDAFEAAFKILEEYEKV